MVITIADSFNSMIQCIFFVYLSDYCLKMEDKQNKRNKILGVILIFFSMQILSYFFGNISIAVFLNHIVEVGIVASMYKKSFKNVLVTNTLLYFFIVINCAIFGNLFFGYFKDFICDKHEEIFMFIIVYIPQIIMGALLFIFKDKIVEINKYILMAKPSIITLIIVNFSFDFIGAFYLVFYQEESKLLKNISTVSSLIFIGIVIMYFFKIQIRINKILSLNKILDEKNNELRKIKNEYGKQISYMYDLYCMNRVDKIGEKLKFIINSNDSNKSDDKFDIVKNNENYSLIKNVLKKISVREIDFIIEEETSLDKVEMTEMELYRVIYNIINNAVKAMNGIGIIIIKTNEIDDNILINIENNGPKIEVNNINQIFEAGFTTKNNSHKNHGYGLNIVKELIEKYNGIIHVESTSKSTKFEIKLPCIK